MVAGTTCPECTDKEIRERLVRIETLLGLMCSALGAVISKVFWN